MLLVHILAFMGSRYAAYLYNCASRAALVAFTDLRVWDRATRLTFTIVQAELQWWPLQSCGYAIALHGLPLQLCKTSYSGGLYRNAGMGSR